jgi:hypothetical protein
MHPYIIRMADHDSSFSTKKWSVLIRSQKFVLYLGPASPPTPLPLLAYAYADGARGASVGHAEPERGSVSVCASR